MKPCGRRRNRRSTESRVAGKQPQNPASSNTRDAAKHTESNGCKSKVACEKASLLAAERRNIKPSVCEMRCNSSNKRSTSRDIIVSFQQVRRQKVRQKRSSACDGLCRRKARKLVRLPFLISSSIAQGMEKYKAPPLELCMHFVLQTWRAWNGMLLCGGCCICRWPCGLMDKAFVFGTKDCKLGSCQGHCLSFAEMEEEKKQTEKGSEKEMEKAA